MTTRETVAAVLRELGPLTPQLDEALAVAISDAEDRAQGMEHALFPHIRPILVRSLLRLKLVEMVLPVGWEMTGNPRQMGQLRLSKHGVMDLRLLKASPFQPGSVPHSGPGRARQDAWRQDPLPALWQESSRELQLLLLWGYADPAERRAGFTLRVVHPLGGGRYGYQVPCDLNEEIPRGGTMFENLRGFVGDDQEGDLYSFQIDSEEDVSE